MADLRKITNLTVRLKSVVGFRIASGSFNYSFVADGNGLLYGGLMVHDSIHSRVLTALEGGKPCRIPFIDRLELWYRGLFRTGRLPTEFRELSLTEIHQKVGIGQQKFFSPFGYRLRGVEVKAEFQGETIFHDTNPFVERFPDVDFFAPDDKPGKLRTEVITPVGRLSIEHTMLDQMVLSGTRSYMSRHPIHDIGDFPVVEYIVEHSDWVPRYEELMNVEEEIGEIGFVVPVLGRIPFLDLLIDYFGTTPMFYALHDSPQAVQRLLAVLDERMREALRSLNSLERPYVEFLDNLDDSIVNVGLFSEYCLPAYRCYTEILHEQDKKVGSHTDGDIGTLLGLLAESGLDVCESLSPYPLTSFRFEQVWEAWEDGPLIWGGIPSPILEERTSQSEFEDYVDHLLEIIGGRPLILGVGDMVLPNNSIERVRHIARLVESRTVP